MSSKKFKERVCALARKVPKGRVTTYKALARRAGNSKAARAVGRLMHVNDYAHSGVPCHRVIKASGELGGYVNGAEKKAEMLIAEGVIVKGSMVDLKEFEYSFD